MRLLLKLIVVVFAFILCMTLEYCGGTRTVPPGYVDFPSVNAMSPVATCAIMAGVVFVFLFLRGLFSWPDWFK